MTAGPTLSVAGLVVLFCVLLTLTSSLHTLYLVIFAIASRVCHAMLMLVAGPDRQQYHLVFDFDLV
jgi:hypothetical protein